MLKKIALFTALAACMGTTYAYQAEVGGAINVLDIDGLSTETGFGVDGTYYFNPVEVKNNPLNEAAFLNRASNVNANFNYVDLDVASFTTYGVGAEYFVPNSNFYVSANIGSDEIDVDGVGSVDQTTYAAEVGYLPVTGLLIAAGLAGVDGDTGDDIDPTLRAKYVTSVGSYDLNVEANAQFGDADVYGIGADLYLDKTLSVGIAYGDKSNEAFGTDDQFTIRAKKFFTQNVSLEAKADFGDDINQYGVRLGYRF
ncbi:putative porin [Acinetobacter shaoyimingii]|uniref:Putative porin n=1 Tax=Acinetobacter shaoyimingii TaxID=2715164 RepID=A0A6G8RRV5_9GAMM|nr:putative porin [Acinetobacter shaoyimingii]QIO04634.1 putative porin [Acinetobacter shaoyimingii]